MRLQKYWEYLQKSLFNQIIGVSKLKTENWMGHDISFVEHNGEWWAIAADIAASLNYSQITNMLRKVRTNQKGLHLIRKSKK